jgi:predicted GNAT superfamily acetyltransferase
MAEIVIHSLETLAEMQAAVDLQRQVWGNDDLNIVPLHMLTTVVHNGGVLLGAWDGQALVGFVFGFLGTDEENPRRIAAANLKHCSHMLGVIPEYRDRGIGYQLKVAQRDFVMQQGVRLITWTYDPLESRNAYLNIARLGGICRTYMREVYGEMNDALNAGLPSDRFQVEWWVTSQRVKQRVAGDRRRLSLEQFTAAGAPVLNPTRLNETGSPEMVGRPQEPDGVFALVEVPINFQALKAIDPGLARAWKLQIRAMFEAAFEDGYIVTDFLHGAMEGRERAFYLLSQGDVKLDGEE